MSAPFPGMLAADNDDADYAAWKKKRQQEDADYSQWLSKRTTPSLPDQRFDRAPVAADATTPPLSITAFHTPASDASRVDPGARDATADANPVITGLAEGAGRGVQGLASGARTIAEMLGAERVARGAQNVEEGARDFAGGAAAAYGRSDPNALEQGAHWLSKTGAEVAPYVAAGPVGAIGLGAAEGVGNVREDLEAQGVDQEKRDAAALAIGSTTGAIWALVPGAVGSRIAAAFAGEANAVTAGAAQQLTLLAAAKVAAKSALTTGAEMAAAGGTAAGLEYAGESAVPGTKPFDAGELAKRAGSGALSGLETGGLLGATAGAIEATAPGKPTMDASVSDAQAAAATGEVPVAPETPAAPPAPEGPPPGVPVAVERPPAPPETGPPPGVPVAVERPPAGANDATAPAAVDVEQQGSAVAPPAPEEINRPPEAKPEIAPPENKTEPIPESVTQETAPVSSVPDVTPETRPESVSSKEIVPAEHLPAAVVQAAPEVQSVDPQTIKADPSRFQFKGNTDEEHGAGPELKGIDKWNPDLAGVISVWRDPSDGVSYVVNGHHRLELAKRLGVDKINVRYIDAPDAQAARGTGAFINLAEGRGTATDVAKFMRDHNVGPDELKSQGVSLRGDLAKRGIALSRLAPDLFDQVTSGNLDEAHAAAIGSVIDDPARQREAVSALRSTGKRLNVSEVTELARQVEAAGTETSTQETLFGTEKVEKGLYVDRARVASAVKKKLAGDRRLFGFVAKEGRAEELARAGGTSIDVDAAKEIAGKSANAEELFDRLYTRSGPIADAVTEAARRVSRGEDIRSVVKDTYEGIRTAIEAERHVGPSGNPGDAQAGGERPPAGEEGLEPTDVRAPGGVDEQGNVRDSTDENQAGMFSSPEEHNRFMDPDLFGGFDHVGKGGQGDMFAPDEGHSDRAPEAPKADGRAPEMGGRITADEIAGGKDVASSEPGYEGPDSGKDRMGRSNEQTRLLEPDATGERVGAVNNPANQASTFGAAVRKITGIGRGRPDAEVQSLRKIAQNLAKGLDLSLEEGRMGRLGKVASGWFDTFFEHSRLRRYDAKRLRTAAHESGHFVSKRWLGWPTRTKTTTATKIPLSKGAIAELDAMGRALYGSQKPGAGYGEEGIAEWFAHFVTAPHVLQQVAPEFTSVMEKVFAAEPDLATPWQRAQEELDRYNKASPQQKVGAMISRDVSTRWFPKWSDFLRATEEQYVGIRQLVRAAVEVRGSPLKPSENPLKRFILAEDVAERVADIVKNGATKFDSDGTRLTKPLLEAFFKVKPARADAFDEYLIAKDAIERAANGIDNGVDLDAARATVEALEPEFLDAAKIVWDNARAMITYRIGVTLTRAEATKILEHHEFYVSNERDFSEDGPGPSSGAGNANSTGVHRQTTGSSRQILPPRETVLTGWARAVRQTHFTKAVQTMVQLAMGEHASATEGIGRFIQEVPAPQVKTGMSLVEIAAQLRAIGESLPDHVVDAKAALAYISALVRDEIPGDPVPPELQLATLSIYRDKTVAGASENRDRVFPVLIKGERRWFQVADRGVLDDLAQLSGKEMDALSQWAGAPARLIREGATSTPGFALWNMGKDAMRQTLYARAGFALPGVRLVAGIAHWLKEDAAYQQFIQSGGGGSGLMPHDRAELGAHRTRLLASRSWTDRTTYVVRHPLDALKLFGEMGETGARVGQSTALYRKLIKQGMSAQDARVEAGIEGRQVGQNFAQMGWLGRALNRYIPFLAPRLGGTYQDLRLLGQPTRPEDMVPGEGKYDRMRAAYIRGASVVTTLAVGSYLMQRDDPEWKKLPTWAKTVSIPLIVRGDDKGEGWDGYGSGKVSHTWYVPLPQGIIGVMFGLMPRAFAEYLHSQSTDAMKDAAGQLFQEVNPLGTRDISLGAAASTFAPLTGAVEDYANRDYYFNRPVVPTYLQGARPEDQSTPGTSETFRRLGKITGGSPARMEHFVNSQTGGIARPFTAALDLATRGVEKATGAGELRPASDRPIGPTASQVPGISRFIRGPETTNSEIMQKFYDRYDAASQSYESWQMRAKQSGNALGARAFFEAHRDDIRAMLPASEGGGVLRKTGEEIAKLRAAMRSLPDTPEGQSRRVALAERMNEIASRALTRSPQ